MIEIYLIQLERPFSQKNQKNLASDLIYQFAGAGKQIDLEKEISGLSASLERCELSELISIHDIYLKIIEKMVSQQVDPDSAVVMSHFGIASC